MMAPKFLYVVDHFVPFPTSEYGGIWNVVAEHDDDVVIGMRVERYASM